MKTIQAILNTHEDDRRGLAFDPAGDRETDPGMHRRCIVTREKKLRHELVRFVVGPDGVLTPDVDERLPGRGFWLSARRDVVEKARATNAFARVARRAVTVPEDLADRVEHLLARRCAATIGLARRSGDAVFGHDQVRAWLAKRRCGVLVGASDGAEAARERLRRVAQAPSVDVLTGAELGAAVGGEWTVHLIIAPGRLSDRLRRDAQRLAGFRGSRASAGHAGNG